MKRNIAHLIIIPLLLFVSLNYAQEVTEIGFYEENGLFAIASKTDYMFLGSGGVVDISIPSDPQLVAGITMPALGTAVKIDGEYAYYGTGMSVRLIVADISEPENIFQLGSLILFQSGNGIFGLDTKDTILMAAAGSDGLYSMNTADKSNPVVIHNEKYGDMARDVIIRGELALVAETDRFSVVDISNSNDWVYMDQKPGNYYSIDQSVEFIFLGRGNGGFDTYSLDEHSLPVLEFSTTSSGGTVWDLKYRDGLVYTASDDGLLRIYQINENEATFMTSYNAENGQSFGLALQDSLILQIGLWNGVSVLQYDSLSTGLTAQNQSVQFAVFPNPAKDCLSVSTENNPQNSVYEIWTANGILVKKVAADSFSSCTTIDISGLKSGMYMIRLSAGQLVSSQKFIVQ